MVIAVSRVFHLQAFMQYIICGCVDGVLFDVC